MKRLTALMLALAMMISVFVPNLSAAYLETMAEDASSIAEEAADASSLRDSQSEEEEDRSASNPEAEAEQPASDPEASASGEPEGGESSDEQKPQGQKAKKAETSRKQKTPKQGIYGKNFDPKRQTPELKHLKKTLKTVDGVTYRLTVSYDKNAGIPDDAKLSVVELNQALTEEELEKKENKKRPCDTERFVSEKALEQDTFDLQQGLKVRKKDYVLFTKFLDLSLTADGKEVQPKAPVTVTLETDVVEEGASDALEAAVLDEKATEQWQKEREKLVKKQEKQLKSGKLKEKDAKRFPERVFRSLKVTNETKKKKGTKVSFRLKEFTRLGVAGVAKRLKSWKVKDETVCVYGPRGLKAKVRKETLKTPKAGMEKVRAFSVKPNEKKNPGYDVTFWVGGVPEQYKTTQDDAAQDNAAQDDAAQDDAAQDDVAQDDAAQDDVAQDDAAQDDVAQDDAAQDNAAQDDAVLSTMSDEKPDTGVVVSELKRGGRTGRTLIGIGGSSAPVAIQSGKSVGLLWDTGLREQSVEAEQVSVEGLLPKNAQVSAEDMLWRYSRPEEVVEDVGEEAETLAAYDITISGRQGEFQPDKGESVSVSIRDESISSRKKLEVWHLKDDGSVEVIRDFSVKGDTISFDASGFSVYLVVQVSKEQTVTASDGKTYKITVTYDSDAGIPEDAELQVSELDAKGKDYQKYVKKTAKKLETEEKNFAFAHAFDIALVNPETGEHCQPTKPLSVSMKLLKEDVNEDSDLDVVHFGDETEVLESSVNGKSIEFETNGFSVYVVVSTVLRQTLTASDGNEYLVTVTYDNTSGIPSDAELYVSEIKEGEAGYEEYVAQSAAALGEKPENLAFARAFDITLKNPRTGEEYQPNKNVAVTIELLKDDLNSYASVDVIHIPDGAGREAEVMDSTVHGESVEFETDGFSVYVLTATSALCTYSFYTYNEAGSRSLYSFESEDGLLTSSVTVKNGEKLIAPMDPTNPSDEKAIFVGWYKAIEGSDVSPDGTPELEANPFDFDMPQSDGENPAKRVSLYAKFSNVLYVRFHGYDASNTGYTSPVIETVKLDAAGELPLKGHTASYNGSSGNGAFREYQFRGWSVTPHSVDYTGDDSSEDYILPSDSSALDNWKINVSTDLDLYPLFTAVRWLTPVSGKAGTSATYFPHLSFPASDGPTTLGEGGQYGKFVPTRPGYVFQGWYLDVENLGENSQNGTGIQLTDANGCFVEPFDNTAAEAYGVKMESGKLSLSKDVSIYARWEKQTEPVSYSIVVWKQLSTEAHDAEEKHYQLAQSFPLTGTVDEPVTVSVNAAGVITATQGTATATRTPDGLDDYTFNSEKSNLTPKSIKPKGNLVFYVYYDRKDTVSPASPQDTYTLKFVMDSELTDTVAPGTALSDKVPASPGTDSRPDYIDADAPYWPQGYGYCWFLDETCSIRVFFADDVEYRNYDNSKVLYTAMPGHDLTLYGKWQLMRFRVDIDPNYGALYTGKNGTGTGSTWFNVDYGEKIEEYTHVTRDYVPSKAGTFYYHSGSSSSDRATYYTEDIDDATELTTFKYQPGTYVGAAWYEVKSDQSEEKYEFGTIVNHDTTLRLHWKLAGTYYLEFNPETVLNGKTVKGILLKGEEALGEEGYSDQSVIFLTAAATPPGGYEFLGWSVRGDTSGTIYTPGKYFTLPAEYAVPVNGAQKVFLDAVYTQIPWAKIIYDANGGTIDPAAVDFGKPKDTSAPSSKTSVSSDHKLATISNLLNNSEVVLSSGKGFSCTVDGTTLELLGWYQVKEDGSRETFALHETRTLYVDTNEPVTLYARWGVKVCFDKNSDSASFGTGWNGYEDDAGQKTTTADLNTLLEEPQGTVTTTDGRTLDFWSTEQSDSSAAPFEFSTQKVTSDLVQDGTLTLYAHYTDAKMVPYHVLEQIGTGTDLRYEERTDWRNTDQIRVSLVGSVAIPGGIGTYVTVPGGYTCQFAFAGTNSTPPASDDDHITAIKNEGGTLKVTKTAGDVALSAGEAIYLVYAPQTSINQVDVKVVYVKESAGGALEKIHGAATLSPDMLTYNGNSFRLNGMDVAQNQTITVTHDLFTISQDMSGSAFHMSPLLDDGAKPLDLVYDRIGVGGQTSGLLGNQISSNISGLNGNVSTGLKLYLKIQDNQLQWRFKGTDAWKPFSETIPTVYVIYHERGFELRLKKNITIKSSVTGIDPNTSFKVTIRSDAITRESYETEGTGYLTVSARPSAGTNQGEITLSVKDGSNFLIKGLGKGEYTITEALSDGSFEGKAKVTVDSTSTDDLNVQNISVDARSASAVTVELSNKPKPICQVPTYTGDPVPFYTLNDALSYAIANSREENEIELLMDYVMPSTDALEIPAGFPVTLTSKTGGTYTITRAEDFNDAPMLTNNGILKLDSITLDGGSGTQTAPRTSSPTIWNEGTLTVKESATLQNAFSSRSGGAISSSGPMTLSGSFLNNRSSGNGGAVYYTGSDEVTVKAGTMDGNSAFSGGAIYSGGIGTITVQGGTMTNNSAEANGGAIYAAGGTVTVSGGTIGGDTAVIGNKAPNGKGGGIYVENAVVQHTGGSISGNSAYSGGGIYAEEGELTLSATMSGNSATANGGGVYLVRGDLTMSDGTMTKNRALNGNGGALYTSAGTITVSGGTIGGGSNTDNANSAKNGSAVFVDKGRATFSGGTITYNTTSDTNNKTAGGAVGVGDQTARLTFTSKPVIKSNNSRAKESGASGTEFCNVYLNQDTDAVITATALASGCEIGIYVPGDFEAEGSLFLSRGTVCARFGNYVAGLDSNAKNWIKNDRLSSVQTGLDSTSNKLYWYKSFQVTPLSWDNYNSNLPPVGGSEVKNGSGTVIKEKWYSPPSSKNKLSEIADDFAVQYSLNLGTRIFGGAFLKGASSYDDYITEINWDNYKQEWVATKRDGSTVDYNNNTWSPIKLCYTYPAYLTIENNSPYTLTLGTLGTLTAKANGAFRRAVNTASQIGFGYVVSIDGETQSALMPIEASSFPSGKKVHVDGANLVLDAGGAVKLMFPGVRSQNFEVSGQFTKDASASWGAVRYTLSGEASPLTWTVGDDPANPNPFSVTGKKLRNDAAAYEIIIGDTRPICKITSETNYNIAGMTPVTRTDGKYDYLFTTLQSAVTFANEQQQTSTIQMLTDYLISSADNVEIPKDCNLTFTTCVEDSEANHYPRLTGSSVTDVQQQARRATLSRDVGYTEPLFQMEIGNGETGSLTILHLNFDGRNLGGSNNYGIIRTKNCDVSVSYARFDNCKAQSGGGISIDFSEDYAGDYGLTVDHADFYNCASTSGTRVGGGAIWTCAKEFHLSNSHFEGCSAADQGGAVFHRIDATKASGKDASAKAKPFTYAKYSRSIIDNCQFINCEAGAAGGFEADSYYVRMTNCTFRNCKGKTRNGGGVNIYIYEQSGDDINVRDAQTDSGTTEAWFEGCVFENCTAGNRGGGLRSLSQQTHVWDCSFSNCTAKNEGGALLLANKFSDLLDIQGCTMDGCKTTGGNKMGGGVYSNALRLTIGDYEYQNGKQPQNLAVGIYTKAEDGTTIARRSTEIKNCESTDNGAGVASVRTDVNSTTEVTNATISGNLTNADGKSGGGIYVKTRAVTLTGCTIQNNTSKKNGGGICYDQDSSSYRLTIDHCNITGNQATNSGGGVWTKTQLTLCNDTMITNNTISSSNKDNAAGVYLPDERTLTVGTAGASDADRTSVMDNKLSNKQPSNLRLWWNSTDKVNHTDSVKVLCNLDGEIRVINAAKKGTKFGVSTGGKVTGFKDSGFKERDHTFIADDDSLYGVFDRTDDNPGDGTDIIWRGDVICKITDKSGNLLYLDAECDEPAIFDRLDYAKSKDVAADGSPVSAFSYLRTDAPALYKKKHTPFDWDSEDNTCCVKLLVSTVTSSDQNTVKGSYLNDTGAYPARTIVLTTAGYTDNDYPYTGKPGTSCVIQGAKEKTILKANTNVILRSIILDGESREKTQGIYAKASDADHHIKVTMERNAVLRNFSKTNDNGGGIYLEHCSLDFQNGLIYNCSAKNGGGVYHKNSGSVTLAGGTITKCKATESSNGFGGGVCLYLYSPAGSLLTMSGGLINGCSANKGGGVYIHGGNIMDMSGGTITANNAAKNGGGIAVGTEKEARLYFSKQVTVTGNTLGGSTPCNVQLDRDSNEVIYSYSRDKSHSLDRGSNIGVYVPGEDTGGNSTLFDKHGKEGTRFGTWDKSGSDTEQKQKSKYLYCFVNDRKGYKGGLQPAGDPKGIYWVKIYSLKIGKQVISDDADDMDPTKTTFEFKVRFFTTSGGTENTIDNEFTLLDANGEEIGTIKSGDTVQLGNGEYVMVDNLPEKFNGSDLHYKVEELFDKATHPQMYENNKLKYTITTYNSSGTRFEGNNSIGVTGIIGKDSSTSSSSEVLSVAAFTNQKAICKLTYNGNLLYYKNSDKRYIPAVYSQLYLAFDQLNGTNEETPLYYVSPWTGQYTSYTASSVDSCNIEMLISDYSMPKGPYTAASDKNCGTVLMTGKTAVLTTASSDATDNYPYVGESGTNAKITRNFKTSNNNNNDCMFRVYGDLTLKDITLDGNGSNFTSSGYGGIVSLRPNLNAQLTIQDGAVLQNVKSSQDGGAVYVNEKATLIITGGAIRNNELTNSNKNGAGIYVKQGGKLKLKGNPDFGGPGVYTQEDADNNRIPTDKAIGDIRDDVGNHVEGALTNEKNGGKDYTRKRQDIYLAGYTDAEAESLIVTGEITSGAGSIWVWADQTPHYKTLEQFAKFDESLIKTVNSELTLNLSDAALANTLEAFRNARPDADTNASMAGGEYLHGMTMEKDSTRRNIYWYGIEGSARVMLVKVQQSGASYKALSGKTFTVYTNSGMTDASVAKGTVLDDNGNPQQVDLSGLTSGSGGAFFIGELSYGTYYVGESGVTGYFEITIDEGGVVSITDTTTNPKTTVPVKTVNLST